MTKLTVLTAPLPLPNDQEVFVKLRQNHSSMVTLVLVDERGEEKASPFVLQLRVNERGKLILGKYPFVNRDLVEVGDNGRIKEELI